MSVTFLFFLVVAMLAGATLGFAIHQDSRPLEAATYDQIIEAEGKARPWATVAMVALVVLSGSAGALMYPLVDVALGGLF